MTDKEVLAGIIKKMRGTTTMAAFGAKYGVKRAAVYNWETARSAPSDEILKLMKIERLYQVTEDGFTSWHYPDGGVIFQTGTREPQVLYWSKNSDLDKLPEM